MFTVLDKQFEYHFKSDSCHGARSASISSSSISNRLDENYGKSSSVRRGRFEIELDEIDADRAP